MIKELRLKDYAGQRCDVVLISFSGEDNGKYIRFESVAGYGFPALDITQLKSLLDQLERF